MFNRKIDIAKGNESILFINAVIENLRYIMISLDAIFCGTDYSDYYDEHTFYFFHMQSVLTAQGNISNVLYNNYFDRKKISRERIKKVREEFGVDLKKYPLIGDKRFRNTNSHFGERYIEFYNVGDMNILRSDTPEVVRMQILGSPHLRTIDVDNRIYYSYDNKGRQIKMDLNELRNEAYNLLTELCTKDIRKEIK